MHCYNDFAVSGRRAYNTYYDKIIDKLEHKKLFKFHCLLFLVSFNGSFIRTILQTGQYIRLFLHQLWSTSWNETKLKKERSDDLPRDETTVPLSYALLVSQ